MFENHLVKDCRQWHQSQLNNALIWETFESNDFELNEGSVFQMTIKKETSSYKSTEWNDFAHSTKKAKHLKHWANKKTNKQRSYQQTPMLKALSSSN